MKLTHARLIDVLDYDRDSGLFTWRKATNPRMNLLVGSVAGCLRPDGYLSISIDGDSFLAHRLAWFWITGQWPAEEIDHKNGAKADNRLANLREANRSQNRQNTRRSFSETGLVGVSWCKRDKRFRAVIKLNGRQKSLGYFTTAESAQVAYLRAKKEIHPFAVTEEFHAP